MKRKTLKEALESWLAFDGYWFWHPDSGLRGAALFIFVALAIVVAWGMWR